MSDKKSSLEYRIKENYENRSKTYLVRRMPVIIRLDGRSFHTFTKGFKRPYDEVFHKSMNETLKYLCENIQGCKIGYTQSDEITLLLTDYDNLDTAAWFDYKVQKMCSIAASMATMGFNRFFEKNVKQESCIFTDEWLEDGEFNPNYKNKDLRDLWLFHKHSCEKGAMFDARVFNIPKEEVANCFIWRQQDATRNAIQMLGQTYFSHKELNNKTCNMIQDMLMAKNGINFNDMPVEFKRGICCIKEEYEHIEEIKTTIRTKWSLDYDIPIFTKDREYIERFVFNNEE